MRLIPGSDQHIGEREEQQDAFGFSNLEDRELAKRVGVMVVVADGMGGLVMGGEASQAAAETMLREYAGKDQRETVGDALRRALEKANGAVWETARRAGQEGRAGSTLVAAVVFQDHLHWISVGDSRLYLYRKGQVARLTDDHVYGRTLEREVREGKLSAQEARDHPERHHLTSYLGLPRLEEVDANARPFPLQPGDRIILCSDGLYGSLTEKEMAEELDGEPGQASESLIRKALVKERPHQDNLTVAILACEPERLTAQARPLPEKGGQARLNTTQRNFEKKGWPGWMVTLIVSIVVFCFTAGALAGLYWPKFFGNAAVEKAVEQQSGENGKESTEEAKVKEQQWQDPSSNRLSDTPARPEIDPKAQPPASQSPESRQPGPDPGAEKLERLKPDLSKNGNNLYDKDLKTKPPLPSTGDTSGNKTIERR
ncbi:SpoIIE family protein phosphatase [Heliobacterium undosum]|uniref:SpoIIE family protein phosphatase n=1 Tax=Heliomicrobium undosum TaxID=121734 RepID=A0A845L037_9FIRM|nr:protein phosphatase 2C domain-containing protein [Heliomicrobium undosum]MZP29822.1 SpoIIE family protein phosphatase [Heliomicrobium undosum]